MASTNCELTKDQIVASYRKYWLLRLNRGLTDTDVSKKADVSRNAFVAWRKGVRIPHVKNLLKIATFLDVQVSDFFEDA